MSYQTLPQTGFLRLPQIIGRKAISEDQAATNRAEGKGPKRSQDPVAAVIPVSKSKWWAGVQSGRYPAPVKLGPKTTAWRVEDIRALIAQPAIQPQK